MSAIPNLPENVLNISSSGGHADDALRQALKTKEASHVEDASKTAPAVNGESHAKTAAPTWQLHDVPVENQRPLRVIVIGAGYSGVYCGIRIPERLRNVELVIYEKNAGIGGTW